MLRRKPSPYAHQQIKSLHKLDEAPPDMDPASLTSETFWNESATTSTGTGSSTNNDELWIKYYIALAGLSKLET